MQLSMSHYRQIRACIAEFPSLDLKSPTFKESKKDPQVPRSVIQSHMARVDPNVVVSSDMSIERFPLILSMTENGLFLDHFGSDPLLFPFDRLQAGGQLPPLFILHGENDLIVPVEGSRAFVGLLGKKQPQAKVRVSIVPGPHGLHEEWHVSHPALQDGLEFVVAEWLGRG